MQISQGFDRFEFLPSYIKLYTQEFLISRREQSPFESLNSVYGKFLGYLSTENCARTSRNRSNMKNSSTPHLSNHLQLLVRETTSSSIPGSKETRHWKARVAAFTLTVPVNLRTWKSTVPPLHCHFSFGRPLPVIHVEENERGGFSTRISRREERPWQSRCTRRRVVVSCQRYRACVFLRLEKLEDGVNDTFADDDDTYRQLDRLFHPIERPSRLSRFLGHRIPLFPFTGILFFSSEKIEFRRNSSNGAPVWLVLNSLRNRV